MSNDKKRHNDSRANRTKKAILQAMFQLLEKENFDNITVNDICLTAQVSRATFYLYFDDKYQLFYRCMDQFKEDIISESKNKEPSQFIPIALEQINKHMKIFRRLILSETNHEVSTMLHIMFVDDITKQLKIMESEGKVFPIPPKVISIFLASGISNLLIWWISGKFEARQEDMADYLQFILDRGFNL